MSNISHYQTASGGLYLMNLIRDSLLLITVFVSAHAAGQSVAQQTLFDRVVSAAECKQSVNNGLMCEYKIGSNLRLAIKDAGGSDEVIGFSHSDINDDYYAIMYSGCIVVVPGFATKNPPRDEGVYISPKNGRIYQTKQECQSAK